MREQTEFRLLCWHDWMQEQTENPNDCWYKQNMSNHGNQGFEIRLLHFM